MATLNAHSVSYICLAAALLVTNSDAALPPQAIEEMQQNASEVLLVSIDKVIPTPPSPYEKCKNEFDIDAKIIRVDRSSVGFSAGQDISFESYTIDRVSQECKGMVGPISPQELTEGWCGQVYLDAWSIDPTDPRVRLSLAAHSGSLIQKPSDQCDKHQEAQEPLGADQCTWAPDYDCWTEGWPSCCFSDDEVCPPEPRCDKPQLLGSDYCTHAPDYNCWKKGWHSCCFSDTEVCPEEPQCDKPQLLGSDYCTYAPDYSCWTKGWHSCCFSDDEVCPEDPQCDLAAKSSVKLSPQAHKSIRPNAPEQLPQVLGSDYCTHAPDYACWTKGWHTCCFSDTEACPEEPQCDKPQLLGSDYCTYAPDHSCWTKGWHSCCFSDDEVCPEDPQCDVAAKSSVKLSPQARKSVRPNAPEQLPQVLGSDYCTHAPDYACWTKGWHSCCLSDTKNCPEEPQCDKPQLLGSDYCTHAPDYSCWVDGWHSCCFSEDEACPTDPQCDLPMTIPASTKMQQKIQATVKKSAGRKPGFCSYAPDYQCYQFGWDQCCLEEGAICPRTKPACDIKPAKATGYCTHAPDTQCWRQGWPDCCLGDGSAFCPTIKPACDVPNVLPPGEDYCAHGMDDFSCYKNGWPSCCLDSLVECPLQKPPCDVLPPGGRMLRGVGGSN